MTTAEMGVRVDAGDGSRWGLKRDLRGSGGELCLSRCSKSLDQKRDARWQAVSGEDRPWWAGGGIGIWEKPAGLITQAVGACR